MTRTVRWQMPGIKTIHTVSPRTIPSDALAHADADINVTVAAEAWEVPVIGMGECETVIDHRLGFPSYKTTLKFETPVDVAKHAGRAWIAELNNGSRILLGVNGTPVPRLEATSKSGDLTGRSSVCCTVTCITAPIDCVLIPM